MAANYMVLVSNKVGLESEEGYLVVRNGISFLRVLGGEPNWDVITATADEDHGGIRVCPERLRLVESALRLCAEYGEHPEVKTDRRGREFVKLGVVTRQPGESEEEFQRANDEVFQRFFEIFDGLSPSPTEPSGQTKTA